MKAPYPRGVSFGEIYPADINGRPRWVGYGPPFKGAYPSHGFGFGGRSFFYNAAEVFAEAPGRTSPHPGDSGPLHGCGGPTL